MRHPAVGTISKIMPTGYTVGSPLVPDGDVHERDRRLTWSVLSAVAVRSHPFEGGVQPTCERAIAFVGQVELHESGSSCRILISVRQQLLRYVSDHGGLGFPAGALQLNDPPHDPTPIGEHDELLGRDQGCRPPTRGSKGVKQYSSGM